MSGALYVLGHCALVLCTVTCGPAGKNFSALGYIFAQARHIFIIDMGNFIGAKQADAFFAAASSFLHHGYTSK